MITLSNDILCSFIRSLFFHARCENVSAKNCIYVRTQTLVLSRCARTIFACVRGVWNSRNVSLSCPLVVIAGNKMPLVYTLYTFECWTMSQNAKLKHQKKTPIGSSHTRAIFSYIFFNFLYLQITKFISACPKSIYSL